MLAAVQYEESLEDALRRALGQSVRSASGRGAPALARCVVCHAQARRERTLNGGFVTACDECGSVLEEEARPQLRLL